MRAASQRIRVKHRRKLEINARCRVRTPARIATRSVAGAVRLCQTPLQIRAAETGLELLLAEARSGF